MVLHEVGNDLVDLQDIHDHILGFYKNLFTTSKVACSWPQEPISPLSPSDQTISVAFVPSPTQTKNTISKIGALKARGHNGYHAFFYHRFWDSVALRLLT